MEDVTGKFIVRKMLEGMRRLKPSKDTRLPITSELLGQLISVLDRICHSDFESALFKAAFALAFHAFLRVGEITVNSGLAGHALLLENVTDVDPHTFELFLPHSKTDQCGKGSRILVKCVQGNTCPVNLLRQYVKVRPKTTGLLFIHFGGLPLTRYQFTKVLHKCLSILGIDSTTYKSHSFRIGAATAAAINGASDSAIKLMGRWSSDAYKSYIRT